MNRRLIAEELVLWSSTRRGYVGLFLIRLLAAPPRRIVAHIWRRWGTHCGWTLDKQLSLAHVHACWAWAAVAQRQGRRFNAIRYLVCDITINQAYRASRSTFAHIRRKPATATRRPVAEPGEEGRRPLLRRRCGRASIRAVGNPSARTTPSRIQRLELAVDVTRPSFDTRGRLIARSRPRWAR